MSRKLKIFLGCLIIVAIVLIVAAYIGSNKFTVADPAKWFGGWGTEQSDSTDKNDGSTQNGSNTGDGSGSQSGAQGNPDKEPEPKPAFNLAFYNEEGLEVISFPAANAYSKQKLQFPADVTDKHIFTALCFNPESNCEEAFTLKSIYLYTTAEEFLVEDSPYIVTKFPQSELHAGEKIDIGGDFTWDMAQDIWGEAVWTNTGKQSLKESSPNLAIQINLADSNQKNYTYTYYVAMDFSQIR